MVYNFAAIVKSQKPEFYQELLEQSTSILDPDLSWVSNLSNLSSLLYWAFNDNNRKINWTGFYIYDKQKNILTLGPFQGRIACNIIKMGKGVCGTSANTNKTIIARDVNEFRGHIACDSKTKSEIVLPIVVKGQIYGVMDLDALELAEFDEEDQSGLEGIVSFLASFLEKHHK
jgi:putative methionine-R-sulfoxide reductase with GAF domain